MKSFFTFLFFVALLQQSYSQYYLRGQVFSDKGKTLSGVKIYLKSKGPIDVTTGDDGSFGIPTPKLVDTITLMLDGYETYHNPIPSKDFQKLTLKMRQGTTMEIQNRLVSFTKNLGISKDVIVHTDMGESYNNLIENAFVSANQNPETGFALNIDRASYSHVRRFIYNKFNVPTEAVRIEQMLNYFSLQPRAFFQQKPSSRFISNAVLTNCPWSNNNQLLFVSLHAPKLNLDSVPPSNLVFLIDISGSMDQANRLPLLQAAFRLLVNNLREQDKISIVTYGGGVQVALNPTSGAEKKKIMDVIDGLSANGDTPGSGAIRTAYFLAKTNFSKEFNNRVILATDGDFNVGQSSDEELENMIVSQRQTGISLTCLGVGMGNFKDSKLETLSKQGNGNYAYIDNVNEAEKVLVTEFTKTLYNVAEDAYVNIIFNPAYISKYRLIGFDNPRDVIADTSNKIQGGEVGSGHSMMAMFEIVPTNKVVQDIQNQSFATLNLRYKLPKTREQIKQSFAIPYTPKNLMLVDSVYRFATSIAMFGSILRGSNYINGFGFESVWQMAQTAVNPNNVSQKEFLDIVDKADTIYNPKKKKKR